MAENGVRQVGVAEGRAVRLMAVAERGRNRSDRRQKPFERVLFRVRCLGGRTGGQGHDGFDILGTQEVRGGERLEDQFSDGEEDVCIPVGHMLLAGLQDGLGRLDIRGASAPFLQVVEESVLIGLPEYIESECFRQLVSVSAVHAAP